uniref:Uncharacterized protein n=1 Tax=Anguilla anguilla TaxID=7936 RepID=A0A0E9V0I9_ANGAN
MYKSVNIFK